MRSQLEELVALNGLSLATVFRTIVLEHPSVVALGRKVVEQTKRHASVFEQGQVPGLLVDYVWDLNNSADSLAYQFVSPDIIFADTPLPKAPAVIVDAATVLAARMQYLRQLLTEGQLIGKGTYCQTGLTAEIGPLQWGRQSVRIDVCNSDLVEIIDHKRVPKWTGISLEVVNMTAIRGGARKKARARVETNIAALHECTQWLAGAMNTSPGERQGAKKIWWRRAQIKWPKTLSRRGFDRAWADAVSQTKASAWAAAGAPRKSTRQSVR
jgi:hypothetical protein